VRYITAVTAPERDSIKIVENSPPKLRVPADWVNVGDSAPLRTQELVHFDPSSMLAGLVGEKTT
jgi:hypothetical protein